MIKDNHFYFQWIKIKGLNWLIVQTGYIVIQVNQLYRWEVISILKIKQIQLNVK